MKKFLTVFFTFTLYFNLFSSAHAAGNVGGWTLGGGVAQGASTVYEGTKKVVIDGVDYIKKGTSKITPPASGVAKVLARGAAGYALSVAVEQLLGSVDWVLDPENNQIKYTLPSDGYLWTYPDNKTKYDSAKQACEAYASANGRYYVAVEVNEYGTAAYCLTSVEKDSPYLSTINLTAVENEEENQRTIPLPTVAQQVISNAQAGDTNAQVATTVAAADIVAEAESDNVKARPIVQQLEASAQTKPADEAAAEKANEATGEAKPNTANPEATDLSIEFPVFCGWAPLVCEAAQVVISFPTTITEIWTAVKEWATKEKDSEDTELEIPEPEQPEIDTEIAFGGNCPADKEIEVDFGLGVIKKPVSYEPICGVLSEAKPALIFAGFVIAALIIGGVKTE